MGVMGASSWGVIVGVALMLIGGLVLWAYGARRDKSVAMALTISGTEAEAVRAFHTRLVQWFLLYGFSATVAGGIILLCVMIFV